MGRFSLAPRDRATFDLLGEAGQNALRAARLFGEMLDVWPEDGGLAREIFEAEQEGDRVTHAIVRRLNTGSVAPLDREDVYALATEVDDVVDLVEEVSDLLGLYAIEAPMEQAAALTSVLVECCEHLAAALSELPALDGLEPHWVEIHRLESKGDRIWRDAVASLFSGGIDPMVVIRWKDIFDMLERAVDTTEKAAHTLEGVVIKNA